MLWDYGNWYLVVKGPRSSLTQDTKAIFKECIAFHSLFVVIQTYKKQTNFVVMTVINDVGMTHTVDGQ